MDTEIDVGFNEDGIVLDCKALNVSIVLDIEEASEKMVLVARAISEWKKHFGSKSASKEEQLLRQTDHLVKDSN